MHEVCVYAPPGGHCRELTLTHHFSAAHSEWCIVGLEGSGSPVGVPAHLHDAPGAALLAFLQLVVDDQLSGLQHTNPLLTTTQDHLFNSPRDHGG